MHVYTQSSVYEFDVENQLCRRVAIAGVPLRKDEEWVKYYNVYYEVGLPMVLELEHLSGDPEQRTFRTTTTVTRIEE